MTPFQIIEHGLEIGAILLTGDPSPDQINILYKLLPPGARFDAELARRWNVSGVICDPDWAADQKKRVPMLRPKGIPAAFLDGPSLSKTAAAAEPPRPTAAEETVLAVVCAHFNVSLKSLIGRMRHCRFAWPRHIAFWLLRRCLPSSFKYIGELMGGRDHVTVIYGLRAVENRMQTEPLFAELVQTLEGKAMAALHRRIRND